MFRTASLSTKLIRIGASLLVVALASISLTLWVTWQLEGGAAAVNEAGRMRMQTWRQASAVQTSCSCPGTTMSMSSLPRSTVSGRSGAGSGWLPRQ